MRCSTYAHILCQNKVYEWEIAKLAQIVDNILTNLWNDNCIILRYILLETKAFHISTLVEID